jgi:pimeloyl-ACP methyl ester carboxylesterase
MGREDYMFLPSIKQISKSQKLSQLSVVENSGHVVNVDQPIEFNNRAISFIRSL